MNHIELTFMDNMTLVVEVPQEVLQHQHPDDERMRWVMNNFNKVKRIQWCDKPKHCRLLITQINGNVITFYTNAYPAECGPDDVSSLIRQQKHTADVDKLIANRIKQMAFWRAA